MTRVQATAEIFWTAYKALPKKEQPVFLSMLFSDNKASEDLIDLAIWAKPGANQRARSANIC
ncbi:MAG: hypothetical protein QME74_04945 [Candidatus Edwardsbacteria bacterium]|nr:hypothetical protein [Candidatus Edwardsbacteria bacterium]